VNKTVEREKVFETLLVRCLHTHTHTHTPLRDGVIMTSLKIGYLVKLEFEKHFLYKISVASKFRFGGGGPVILVMTLLK
jgi:hypothetical protein